MITLLYPHHNPITGFNSFKDDYKDDVGSLKGIMEPPTGKENVLQDVALEIDALLSGVPELSPSGSAATKPAQDAAGADLLGLSLDDEFSDFMSAPAPFLPSALLTNCILTDDGAFDFSASLPPDHGDPLQALQASDAEQPTANSASSKSSV